MKDALMWLALSILKLAFLFRYKITYKGLDEIVEKLKGEKKGILFLPNHPAVFSDPLIVTVPLLQHFQARPLIVDYMYFSPIIHWATKFIRALPIPNFSTGFNPFKQRRAEKALQQIEEGLKAGDRFLIYPSGTSKLQAREVIGGAFAAHELVSKVPDIQIVLVRTTGLWGSVFSRASTQGMPPKMACGIKKSFWTVLKNLFFFVPKRRVLVEFELASADLPKKGEKLEFNRYLERWYNKPFESPDGTINYGEPLYLVSYSFWKEDYLEIPKPVEEKVDLDSISDEIKKVIIKKVAELAKKPENTILPTDSLQADLALDSLDLADLVTFLEDLSAIEA